MKHLQTLLLIYCILFTLLLLASGIATATSLNQLLLLFIFFPVALHFLITIVHMIKRKNHPEDIPHEPKSRKKRVFSALFILLLFFSLLSISVVQILNKNAIKKEVSVLPEKQIILPSPPISSPSAHFIQIISDTPTSLVHIRKEATTSALSLTKVKPQSIFPLVAKRDDWYEIQLDKTQTGFVYKDFAREESKEK